MIVLFGLLGILTTALCFYLLDKRGVARKRRLGIRLDEVNSLCDRRLTEVLHRLNDIQIALGQEPGDPPPLYDVPEEMYDHADT